MPAPAPVQSTQPAPQPQQQQVQQPQQQPAQQAALPSTESQKNWTWCFNPGKQFTADVSINGCNAVISANKDQPRDMANAYYNRAVAYRSKGNLDRAIDDFGQAMRLEPKESEFVNDRGAAYHAKGDIDRAIADYDRAIQLNPKAAEPYSNRGSAFQRKGDFARASADYGEVTKLQPENVGAWVARCWVRGVAGRELQQAMSDCNQVLKLKPDVADALDSRGMINLKLGQNDAAIKDYDAALKIDPKLPTALYGRGVARQKKGDRNGGNSDINAARNLKANIADEMNRYGVRPN